MATAKVTPVLSVVSQKPAPKSPKTPRPTTPRPKRVVAEGEFRGKTLKAQEAAVRKFVGYMAAIVSFQKHNPKPAWGEARDLWYRKECAIYEVAISALYKGLPDGMGVHDRVMEKILQIGRCAVLVGMGYEREGCPDLLPELSEITTESLRRRRAEKTA